MNYLCIVYSDHDPNGPETLDALALKDACIEQDLALHAAGKLVMASPLEAPETSKTIRYRNGVASSTDGPFAEAKEWIAGFMVIQAQTMEEAVAIATDGPPVGILEIRPILEESHSTTGKDRSVFFQRPRQ